MLKLWCRKNTICLNVSMSLHTQKIYSHWRWSRDVYGTMGGVTRLLMTFGNFVIMYTTTFGLETREASVNGKVMKD